jgi:hypothetical protein
MLMTLEAIRNGLKARHAHPSFDRSNLMLVQPGVSAEALQRARGALRSSFPVAFENMVAAFSFDRLIIHKLAFEYGKELKRFTQTNLGEPYAWWKDDKPENQLWVAQTGKHYLTLHTSSGKVHAFNKSRHDDQGQVAADFEKLVRAAGSLELQPHTAALVGKIAKDAGADPDGIFWELLAEGSA